MEAGEIRCPNYAYERVFLHMFPGLTLADLGFSARETVRGRASRATADARPAPAPLSNPTPMRGDTGDISEESDVLRRAFMTNGTASMAVASLGIGIGVGIGIGAPAAAVPAPGRRARPR